MIKNTRQQDEFLTKLDWMTNMGEWTVIRQFQVDIYRFVFEKPLTGELMTEFSGYLKTLNLSEFRTVKKIWVWLYQHEVKFKTVFGYNPRAPFSYNLKHLVYRAPKKLDKTMLSFGHDDLMACRLDIIALLERLEERERRYGQCTATSS